MSMMIESTQTYSTVESWTDFQSLSEKVTEIAAAEVVQSTSFHLKRLIPTAVFVGLIILANAISLLAFMTEKRLRTYNNYFIINLTILDLLIGIGLLFTAVFHIYLGHYPYSQNACKILSGIFNGIVNASNITVIVVCADRHQAVYDPINHFISRSKRKAVILNFVPLAIGLSFWLGYVTIWEFVIDFDNGDHCIHQFSISPWTNIIQRVAMFFLPLAIIAVLYFRIFLKIRKSLGGKNVDKKFDDVDLSSTVKTATAHDMTSSTSLSGTTIVNVEKDKENAAVVELSLPGETTIKTSGSALPVCTLPNFSEG